MLSAGCAALNRAIRATPTEIIVIGGRRCVSRTNEVRRPRRSWKRGRRRGCLLNEIDVDRRAQRLVSQEILVHEGALRGVFE